MFNIAVRFVILYKYWRLRIVFFTWGPSVLLICDHSVFVLLEMLYFLYSVVFFVLFGYAVSPFFRPFVYGLQAQNTLNRSDFQTLPPSVCFAVELKERESANEKLPLPEPNLCTDQSLTGRRSGGGVKSADVVHMVAIRIICHQFMCSSRLFQDRRSSLSARQ